MNSPTLGLLCQIARRAGDAIATMSPSAATHARVPESLQGKLKAPHELVTAADQRSHVIIKEACAAQFPTLPLLLEEQTAHEIPHGAFLVGDELDGTAVFAAGTADWGVTLARIDGAPTHGVIYLPQRGLLIAAERGAGCFINEQRIQLPSTSRDLTRCVLGVELNPRVQAQHRQFQDALVSATLTTRCTASSTASIAELLLGHTQIYVNCGGGKIWDFAAGALALQEAGGVALAVDGTPLNWSALAMNILFAAHPSLINAALAAA